MHLIEDMAVPAHTRNDSHLRGDFYEQWVADNEKSDMVLNGYSRNLVGIDQAFDELAGYSNKYFLTFFVF